MSLSCWVILTWHFVLVLVILFMFAFFFLWQPHVICAFRSTRILFKLNLYFVSIWNQILHLVSFSSFSPPFISRLVFVSFYHGRAGIFSWHVILSLPLISCFYQFFLYLHMSTLPDMLRFIFLGEVLIQFNLLFYCSINSHICWCFVVVVVVILFSQVACHPISGFGFDLFLQTFHTSHLARFFFFFLLLSWDSQSLILFRFITAGFFFSQSYIILSFNVCNPRKGFWLIISLTLVFVRYHFIPILFLF